MVSAVVGLHVLGLVALFAFVAPGRSHLAKAGIPTMGLGVTAYTLGLRHAFDADHISEFLSMDEPRARFAARMSGLDVHYDLGEGHPLLGRRMPDLDLLTANGPLRVFTLLHDARPVLLNLAEPGGFDIAPWADRVQLIDAKYVGTWELPALGEVAAPTGVLIRPDGYVSWVADLTERLGLSDSLTTWFGPPTVA
jgi:hypothetical protein